jgi:hypothetical protein
LKVIGILQAGYLPWLGFFEQMLWSDIFVILDDVQYDKHGWRNRNRVKGPQGPVWLTVPVRTKGLNQPKINEVIIDPASPQWGKKHLGTIRQLYAKAPFFSDYFPALETIWQRSWTRLLDLNLALTTQLARWLEVERDLILSSRLDCRNDDPTGRLVDICRGLGADIFYEGASGRNYLHLEQFAAAGVEVVFQDYQPRPYPQLHGAFVSHLSALDLLLNCGPRSREYLLGLGPEPFARRPD